MRSHLAYLKLQTAAERLAPALEAAEQGKPAYAEFLDGLLDADHKTLDGTTVTLDARDGRVLLNPTAPPRLVDAPN